MAINILSCVSRRNHNLDSYPRTLFTMLITTSGPLKVNATNLVGVFLFWLRRTVLYFATSPLIITMLYIALMYMLAVPLFR